MKQLIIKKLAPLLFLVMSCCLGFTSLVAADASPINITITPSSTAVTVKPGASVTKKLTVLNEGVTPYTFNVSVAPYSVVGTEYNPSFIPIAGTTNASSWIQLSAPVSNYLGIRSIANIDYSITVPANTAPGGYYAVIFAKTTPLPGSSIRSSSQVGNIIYLTVAGAVKRAGSAHMDQVPLFTSERQLALGITLSNTGGVHYVAATHLSVQTILGKRVYANSSQHYVLPQTVRDVSGVWKTPSFGIYRVTGNATVNGKRIVLPGKWLVVVHSNVIIGLVLLLLVGAGVIALRLTRKYRTKNGTRT